MKKQSADTTYATIFMAGPIDLAKQVCREFCLEVGLCVTIEAVDYIYTGGEEAGFRIGLINYPRFPSTADEIRTKAELLAERLRERLCQHSYTVMMPDRTIWSTTRRDSTP